MRLRSLIVGGAVTAGAWLTPGEAGAFERQWRLGGGLGAAGLTEAEGAFAAPFLGLHGAYGVSDLFDAMVELGGSTHGIVRDDPTRVFSASVGMAYKLDVIEWIPYFAVLAAYYRFTGPSPFAEADQLGAGVALGIDYAFSREFAVGAQVRYHGFMDDLPGSVVGTGGGPYFTSLLRFEHRWGF